MVNTDDLWKLALVYICLFQVTPVYPTHPCGDNPVNGFMALSRQTGRSVDNLLAILKRNNVTLYRRIDAAWQSYSNCVGRVDTGYFKRSSPETKRDSNTPNNIFKMADDKFSTSSFLSKLHGAVDQDEKKGDISVDLSNIQDSLIWKWFMDSLNPRFLESHLSPLQNNGIRSCTW